MAMKPEHKRPWDERRVRELVCRDRRRTERVVRGERSWWRPGELVVDQATLNAYARNLPRDQKLDQPIGGRRDDIPVQLVQIRLDEGADVQDLTTWIRRDAARRQELSRVVVGPNYCWRGEPIYHGGPGGEPRRAEPRRLVGGTTSKGATADIAALDTGYLDGLPAELMSCLAFDKNDKDVLDSDGNGVLDTQNGHGSFVAGIVHQLAPGLVIDTGRVLDPTGLGDDATVTRELLETRAPVINLSLGGYTEDDRAPVAMNEVVRALTRSAVVVAAAGNNSSSRPFWPGAFKGVLAVAAYESGGTAPAPFSNRGPWVDVCAPGTDIVSTFATFPVEKGRGRRQFDGWAAWDGTSFAAPQVAAVIAQRIRDAREKQEPLSPWAAVAWFLEQCRYEPALASYGLVWEPQQSLV